MRALKTTSALQWRVWRSCVYGCAVNQVSVCSLPFRLSPSWKMSHEGWTRTPSPGWPLYTNMNQWADCLWSVPGTVWNFHTVSPLQKQDGAYTAPQDAKLVSYTPHTHTHTHTQSQTLDYQFFFLVTVTCSSLQHFNTHYMLSSPPHSPISTHSQTSSPSPFQPLFQPLQLHIHSLTQSSHGNVKSCTHATQLISHCKS